MLYVSIELICAILISFLLTLYLVPLCSTIAYRIGVLDIPDGKIKKHEKSIPYLGGVAVYLGFIITLALLYPFENQIFLFLIGITLLLFLGLVDDIICMQPYQKFFGQMIVAFCFFKSGIYLKESFFLNNYWGMPLSMFWTVLIINSFNLVDVMDGLATTIALCVTGSFLILALSFREYQLSLLLGSFLGPLLAFFYYNKPPATIYLGDAGSLFIGGFLAAIPFLFSWGHYNYYGFFVPIIILTIPLLEVGTLVLLRSYKRIPFYKASPDHFCIYLRESNWSKNQILLYIFVLSLFLLGLALLVAFNRIEIFHLILLILVFLFNWFFILSKNYLLP